MTNVAGREVQRNDLAVMAAGAAALVFSFLPYWGVSYKIQGVGGASASVNAWHGVALLGVLLLVAAASIVAARVFGGATLPTLPVGWNLLVAGLAALGTVILIIRGFTYGNNGFSGFGSSVSSGVKWGGYLLFIAAIVETAFAIMAFRESGESLSFDRGPQGDVPPPATT
jgi:hypothetical protein